MARGDLIDLQREWLTAHAEYLKLGPTDPERQFAYRELFRTALSRVDLADIRACTHKGWALGGDRFKRQIETLGQRRAVSKGVGAAEKGKQSCLTPFLI